MRNLFARLIVPALLLPLLGGAGFVNLKFSGWRTFEIPGIPYGIDPSLITPEVRAEIAEFTQDPELVRFSLADVMGELDIRTGDVVEARIDTFTVEGSADLGFLSAVEVWLIDGLEKEKLAARYAVPAGSTTLTLGLHEVDLVPYLTTEDPIISVRVNGLPPMQNVDIRADYTLKFAVSAQGACGAGRILKDYKDADDTGN
jgi:hypothetical protein